MKNIKSSLFSGAVVLLAAVCLSTATAWAASSDANIDLSDSGTPSGTGWTYNNTSGVFTITSGANVTISGTTTTNTVVVASGATANITLSDASIDVRGSGGGCAFDMTGATVTLTLSGTNILRSGAGKAGVQAPSGASLTITAANTSQTLTVTSGGGGAGIGGGVYDGGGNITISGGTVTATGGATAGTSGTGAGIGGGANGSGGTITITGGTVTANGGSSMGAGIGGGSGADGGNITISGGTVTATGGGGGAGIGGSGGSGGTVTISGGTVTATGGTNCAGIGGGNGYAGGTVIITSGTVIATGGGSGAGIGGGASGSGGTVTISGGTVEATGGLRGAGIGGGASGSGGTITINDGTVTATGGGASGYTGTGIGGGWNGAGGNVTINDGTVTATAGNYGAGIGYTYGGSAGTVSINGGTVTATGGTYGGKGIDGTNSISGSPTLNVSSVSGATTITGGTTTLGSGSTGDLTVVSGATLEIQSGATLTVPSGTTLTNEGTITNNGTITNGGTVINNGTIIGTIGGTITKNPGSGSISLANWGYGDAPSTITYNSVVHKGTDGNPTTPTVEYTVKDAGSYNATQPSNAGDYTVCATYAANAYWDELVLTADFTISLKPIDIAAIAGVTVPAVGNAPVASITETAQYTGTVSWSHGSGTFDYATAYTATITLTPKTNYTLTGVTADFFTVAGTTGATHNGTTNPADNGVVTATFPATASKAAVSNTIGAATVVYGDASFSGNTLDLSALAALFTIDPQAGAATYTDEGGGTGTGTMGGDNKTLTVATAGTFNIGLATAETATHAAGAMVTAVLTVNKATQTGFAFAAPNPSATYVSGFTYTQAASGGTGAGAVTYAIVSGGTTAAGASINLTTGEISGVTGTGTIQVRATKAANDLYDEATADYTLTIDPKPIDIAAIAGVTIPAYGNTPVASITETAQYTGAVSWSPSPATFEYATAYTATITLTPKANYTLTGVTADFFTVAGTTGATHNGTTNPADNGVVTATFPATASKTAVSNTIGAATVVYGDASFSGNTLDLSALATLFTIDPQAGTATYTNEGGGTGTGTMSGDNKTLTVATAGTFNIGLATAETATHAAGAVVIAVLTVNKAVLTVTAEDTTRLYGDANPAFRITYSGWKNSEGIGALSAAPTATTAVAANSAVGAYPITAAGGVSGNYAFTYVDGTLTINKATLTVTADNKSKIYGDANPTLTVAYSGFVNGDNESNLSTAPTASTAATTGSAAGAYTITAAGGVSGNYAFTYLDGTLTVGKATLTVTADNKSKIYGDANPTLTVAYSGFVNGDNESNLSTAPTASTAATATTPIGTYPITAAGGVADNYAFTYVDGALTVSKQIPAYTLPTGLTATVVQAGTTTTLQTLADISLPAGWAWDEALSASVGEAGERNHPATFTPADTVNYSRVTAELTILVTYLLDFDTYVATKWNNAFILNLEQFRANDYIAAVCRWYRDGELQDTGMSWTPDKYGRNQLPGHSYYFEMDLTRVGNASLFTLRSTVKVIDALTGITTDNAAHLVVYPNPTNGQLTMDNEQLNAGDKVEIYNVNGVLVGAYSIRPTINIAHLPAGIYIVRVGNKAAKVVKQ
ncbi:hypothetical protein FACS1894156_0720 [Bacteroidia bacterium]|nr:hypothetical protein FACS1894156_0720 [Bacteroidia bacterium]